MNGLRLLTILVVGMSLSACAQFTPYRTAMPATSEPKYFECVVDDTVPNLANLPLCEKSASADSQTTRQWPPNCVANVGPLPKDGRRCEDPDSQTIQHRYYQTNDEQEGDYYLSFVEFDDQGWFTDRRQMEALFTLLKDIELKNKEADGHILIQVYAHGWKHNASACDNNVLCFSRLLERTDLAEKNREVTRYTLKEMDKLLTEEMRQKIQEQSPEVRKMSRGFLLQQVQENLKKMPPETRDKELGKIKPRTVVGVYLGWRGLPFDTALNNLSFWSRKDTAARVGSGGVFELLTRLKDYRDIRQGHKSADANKTQLVITGHSFGGLVIYSALSHALMERAAKTMTDADGAIRYDVAKSFGDFVMLVNPAFEGSLYEPLFNITTNRCYDTLRDKSEKLVRPIQKPVMMIVTSEADDATGIAFPVGRALDTLFQHKGSAEQGDSMRKTIGHDERYKTHDLKLSGDRDTLDDKYIAKSACDCPHLRPTSELTLAEMQGDSFEAMFDNNYGKGLSLKSVSSPKYASNYPYLVVTTNADVIADHNAIYNGKFTLFAQQFVQKHITLEEDLPAAPNPVRCWPENEPVPGALVPLRRSCDDGGKPCTWQTKMN